VGSLAGNQACMPGTIASFPTSLLLPSPTLIGRHTVLGLGTGHHSVAKIALPSTQWSRAKLQAGQARP